jgi:hypothetical protein
MYSQIGATTGLGKRLRNRYTDIINAEAPRLPEIYRRKDEREHRDKVFDFNKQQATQEQFNLDRDYKRAKRQDRKGNKIALAGLGMNLLNSRGGGGWGLGPQSGGTSLGSRLWGGTKDIIGNLYNNTIGSLFDF